MALKYLWDCASRTWPPAADFPLALCPEYQSWIATQKQALAHAEKVTPLVQPHTTHSSARDHGNSLVLQTRIGST
jgi:hypothetical protein